MLTLKHKYLNKTRLIKPDFVYTDQSLHNTMSHYSILFIIIVTKMSHSKKVKPFTKYQRNKYCHSVDRGRCKSSSYITMEDNTEEEDNTGDEEDENESPKYET